MSGKRKHSKTSLLSPSQHVSVIIPLNFIVESGKITYLLVRNNEESLEWQ